MGMPLGRDDTGFSLAELVVAMFLLAILALAALPLVIGSTQTSSVNRSLVSATTFANAQLAPIRATYTDDAAGTSCAALRSLARTDVAGPSGSGLLADIVIGACPASGTYPGTVAVTISVTTTAAPTTVLTEVRTFVVVAGS